MKLKQVNTFKMLRKVSGTHSTRFICLVNKNKIDKSVKEGHDREVMRSGLCHQTDLHLNSNSTTFFYQHLYFSNYKRHMCL